MIKNKKELCVGIIMDGNRRFARAKGESSLKGHQYGKDALKELLRSYETIRAAHDVRDYIFYAFSTENWNRSKEEVATLMELLERALGELEAELAKLEHPPRICFIGDRARFSPALIHAMNAVEERTKGNDGTVALALSYGGRDEIVRAVNTLVRPATEETLAQALDTRGMVDPDIIIRTGGEKRLSNFLLWQSAYSELFFLDILWPEFTAAHLIEVLKEFALRERRNGV